MVSEWFGVVNWWFGVVWVFWGGLGVSTDPLDACVI